MRILRSSQVGASCCHFHHFGRLLHHMHPYFDLSLAATNSSTCGNIHPHTMGCCLEASSHTVNTHEDPSTRIRVGWRDLLSTTKHIVIAFGKVFGIPEPYTAFRVPVGFAKRSSDFCLCCTLLESSIDDSASSGQ
jgi:hypothetical protein